MRALAILVALTLVPARTAAGEVAVVGRDIARGQLLGAADLRPEQRTEAEARAALDPREALGMEAARPLRAGTVLRRTDLVPPQLVRRGEPVTLTLRDGGLAISSAGRALGGGGMGDPVRVVALSTNRTLDGTIDGPASVRILSR